MTARAPPADAKQAIESRLRTLGPAVAKLQPTAVVAVLGAAALWPVVAPLLGTGAAVGVAGGTMGLLSGPGQQAITDFLQRLRGSRGADAQAELERALLERMEARGAESRALRDDLAHVLREVQGVQVALAAVQDDMREALARSLSDVAERWDEFAWLLAEVRIALTTVQARQAEALAMQRTQLDMQREQLVKTNLLLRERRRRPPPKPAPRRRGRPRPPPADVPVPYKGLRRFEPEDAALFFGRDRLRAELLARIAESRILALVGDSGSGKSSLLRAGLIRSIWDGGLPGSSDWPVAMLSPGERPLEELAVRMAALMGTTATALGDLRTDPRALAPAARQAMLAAPDGARLLLAVDQLEELFTLSADDRGATAFMQALLAVAERPFAAVVLAIRSDYLGRLAALPGVPAALRGNEVLVGPLDDDELRLVVESPALEVGLGVEPGLADVIAAEVAREPGALPLVSHALLETFERSAGSELRISDYNAAGGVRDALTRTADAVLAELTAGERAIARDVFLRLSAPGEDAEPARRRVRRSDLVPDDHRAATVEAVIERLVDARLLTSGEATVEIAHEALIRHWPVLRAWLAEDPAGERLRQRLTAAAGDWRRLDRDPGALYRGALVESALEWAARHPDRLRPEEREFLDASQQVESEELAAARRDARRLRGFSLALTLLLLTAGGLAWLAVRAADRADEARALAERQAAAAASRSAAIASSAARAHAVDQSLLLALEAYRIDPSAEARAALVGGLGAAPRLLATLRGRAGVDTTDVAISSGGRFVAASGADATVRLWDLHSSAPLGAPLRTAAEANAVVVGDQGRTVVAASAAGLQAWDVAPGAPPSPRPGRRVAEVVDIAASSDGSLLALVGGDGSVRLRRVAGLRPAGTVLGDRDGLLTSVSFAPGDRVLATAVLGEPRIDLWDVRTTALKTSLPTDGAYVRDVALGARVAVAVSDRGLEIWDVHTLRPPTTHPLPGNATAVALAEGRGWAAAGSEDGGVHLVDLRDPERSSARLGAHGAAVSSVTFSSDGSVLASAAHDGTTLLWSTRRPSALGTGGQVAERASVPAAALPVLSGDGRRVATVTSDGQVDVWEVSSGARVGGADIPDDRASTVALDSTGRTLAASGFEDPGLTLWDVDRGSATSVPGAEQPATAVALGAGGSLVAAGGHDGVVRVWDRASGRRVAERRADVGIDALAIDHDGRLLAAAAQGTLRIWRLGAPGAAVAEIGDGGAHKALAFTPDSGTLASASGTKVRFWDTRAGLPLGEPLRGHRSRVHALAFGADGSLMSVDDSLRSIRWDPLLSSERLGAWRERVCRAVGRSLSAREWDVVLRDMPYRPACG